MKEKQRRKDREYNYIKQDFENEKEPDKKEHQKGLYKWIKEKN